MYLLNLLFPNRCLECNAIIAAKELICPGCLQQINFSHHSWTENNLLRERCAALFPVHHAFSLMYFEKGALAQKILHQLKYNRRQKIGSILAQWTLSNLELSEDRPDLIITVPLHPKKQRERGYNQLSEFARQLSIHYQIPFEPNLVKRNFYSRAQATKKKAQRKTENIFSSTRSISGLHILIIDDVYTTGNTMSAVAWEILQNPDNKVSVLVMAMEV